MAIDNHAKEQLKVRAFKYSIKIIRMLDSLPRDYVTETIGKQLIRSATSIGANVIEAQAASSRKDFTNFLSYSLKSTNETKYWLGLIKEARGSDDVIEELLKEADEFSNILGASILTLKGKR